MATFTLPNTQTGGSQQIQAGSLADAESQAQSAGTWSPAAGTYGSNSTGAYNPSSGGGGGGGSAPAPQQQQGALDASYQKMLQALASGNAQAFQEAVREFNQNFALAEAGVTGTYNGKPTQSAQQQQNQQGFDLANLLGYYYPNSTGNIALDAFNLKANPQDQQTYLNATGGDRNVAAARYWNDVQGAIRQAVINAGGSGNLTAQDLQNFVYGPGQQTLAGQNQQFQQGVTAASLTGLYNGNPTLASQLQNAQLTGQYNGNPTEAAREFNTQQAEAARQFNANLAQSLLNAATQLRGPQDYMQYQQLTHGGANLLSQLTSPNAVPQTSGAGQTQSAGIMDVLNALGIGNGGSNQATSNPSDVQSQVLQRFGLAPGQTLNPTQINPARYDQIGSIGQALTKNVAESQGYDPTDFENQINKQRPVGTASGLTTTSYRAPTGIF